MAERRFNHNIYLSNANTDEEIHEKTDSMEEIMLLTRSNYAETVSIEILAQNTHFQIISPAIFLEFNITCHFENYGNR